MSLELLKNRTLNGAGDAKDTPLASQYRNAPLTFYFFGTFGGATVILQSSPDGTNWVNVPDSAVTAPTILNVDISTIKIRASVSNASGSTNISVIGL